MSTQFVIYQSDTDSGEECWRWKLRDEQGNILALSEEAFLKGSVVPSIKRLRQEAQNAAIWEDESVQDRDKGYRFEYSRKECNKVNWRFRSGNHQTMAIGSIVDIDIEANFEQLKIQISGGAIVWEHEEDDPAHSNKCDDRTETRGIPGS